MNLSKYRVLPAVVWLLLILAALLTPGEALPKAPFFSHADKIIHFSLFAVLTFLWSRVAISEKQKNINKTKFFTIYLVFGIVFAILVEYLQNLVPNRSFDLSDIAANLFGGTIGIICFYILHRSKSIFV